MHTTHADGVAVSAIRVPPRKRPLVVERVGTLVESIRLIGLLNPITVTDERVLVAGAHRLEAARALGWETIPAYTVPADDLLNRLVEIDENLIRQDLTVLEQAEHVAERESIVRALGMRATAKDGAAVRGAGPPETVSGDPDDEEPSEPPPVPAPAAPPAKPKTTAALAAEAGLSPRSWQQRHQIATNLTPETKAILRDTPVADSTTVLLDLARVKDPDQQVALAERIADGKADTVSRARGVIRQEVKAEVAAAIRKEPPPAPKGPFRVIVADPPWKYGKRAEDVTHRARLPYPEMETPEICALPVPGFAHDDCILWLWTTNAHMRDAYAVLDAWGFTEKTILTWAKNRMGTGDWLRGQTEHCILAVRGRPLVQLTNQTTLLPGPVREHSRKPDEFYALVEALCPGSKVEMFSRQPRDGWGAWGAETEKFDAAP